MISGRKDTLFSAIKKDISGYLRVFTSLHNVMQDSDMPPTTQMISRAKEAENKYAADWSRWFPK
jgi:hypothetical protein